LPFLTSTAGSLRGLPVSFQAIKLKITAMANLAQLHKLKIMPMDSASAFA
jgi:hypothetical protein